MGDYGKSFSRKLFDDGKLDESLAAATREHELDGSDPAPLATRGNVLAAMGDHERAVADYVQALELDRQAQELDTDALDDDLFDALRGWALAEQERAGAESQGVRVAVEILERYRGLTPCGRHLADVERWVERLRGRPEEPWVKEKL
jgi:tetratricopeptide (TPR) repeat protein